METRRFFLCGMRVFFGVWLLYVGLSKWLFMGPATFDWQFLVMVLVCAALSDPEESQP